MKAMVLAAGFGERMRPLTEHLPKPLLPIANRPVMSYILEHLARHEFTDVIANLHYRPEQIVDYFGDGSRFGVNLAYTHEEHLWGIAGGVRRCKDFFDGETFLVIGADDLTDMDLTALLADHRRVGAMASIGLVEVEETSQYGIVVTDGEGRIQRFVEKPKGEPPSRTANTQIYLFESGVFDFIPPNQVYDFGFDAFPHMVAQAVPFYGFSLPGYWRDIGGLADYLAAHVDALEGRVAVRLEGEQMRPGVWVGPGCQIDPTARLTAPVVLAEDCAIGPEVALGGGTALGRRVHVPSGSSLWNTVVWEGASMPPEATLMKAVVTPQGVFTG
ncbi:MAG: NDP-sugar synthase [Armatimonadota bacterium]|nr:MAG: NDP-sugar synthase [Armatimonadota bacterium]